jgi:hypothetical protein
VGDHIDLACYAFIARYYFRGFAPIDPLVEVIGGGQLTDKLQWLLARLAMRFGKDLTVRSCASSTGS